MRKKFISIFMALAMFFINIPTSIFAAEVNESNYELKISELSIHDYVTHNNTVYQGDSTGISFKFSIDPKGNTLGENDKITVKTNIAEIFDIPDDGIKDMEIKNHNNELLMKLDIKVDENSLVNPDNNKKNVVLVFKNFKNISQIVTGSLSTKDLLTAKKDNGATEDKPSIKDLTIGNAIQRITIKAKNQNPTETTFDPVDIDVLWKNASSRHLAYQGAASYIEVNPIGSMDLYGSTTHTGRNPKSYKNFIVEDKIPEKGYIKEDTMQIYAAIPTLSKAEKDYNDEWHKYKVNKDGFYAKRDGTSRVSLLKEENFIGTWEFVKNSSEGGGIVIPPTKPEQKPEPEEPDRIEGGDRVDTSIDASEDLFPNGTDAVVLANCERYTDVLTANPFAIQIKAAALFTYKDKLPEKTLKEIERLGAKKIYISGGYDAVSKKVVDELINKGYDVFRFDGVNRYDTARKIAIKIRENGNKNVAELASGENYPDALSMTSMAVKDNAPILLTKKDSIPSYTKQALAEWDIETIKIAGLDEAISNNVEKQIKNGFAIEENNKKDSNVYDGAKLVSRFGGKDRYETSTVIAKESYPNSKLGVYATGEKFPDALIAGNYAGRKKAPVLLVKKDTLPESVKKYTANSKIEKATIIGGSKAVSDNVIEFIKEAIKNRKN